MTKSRKIALDLMRRLFSGERGQIPLHLSLLLERSLLVEGSDETQYRQILPPELTDLKLSSKTRNEIISALCTRVLEEPDESLLAAMSFAGTDLVTKTMSSLLTKPPRRLAPCEKVLTLSILAKFLPPNLAANSQLLSRSELTELISVLKQLQHLKGMPEESSRSEIERHAGSLLKGLSPQGFV